MTNFAMPTFPYISKKIKVGIAILSSLIMKLPKTYINAPDKPIIHGHWVSVDLSPDIEFEPSEVNGAFLIDEAFNEGVKFNRPIIREDGYIVSDLEMTIPQDLKMGEVFDRVPYGIINKTITGLGATTLEILTPKRNSIIVVPTKTLAYSKTKKANEEKGENYAMYIGSPIGDVKSNITIKKVKAYLDSKRPKDVNKFIVVADSLPMLLDFLTELEVEVYENYFLMVDEIDTLQLDSSYRPRLEIVMDHYFKFDINNRAVVSATIIPFSNPLFSEDESILKIMQENQPIRDIKLQYSNYVEDAAIAAINNKLQTTEDKILIAYNSLDGVFNIIDQIDIDKAKCGILCSERSSEKVADYSDNSERAIDENGNLFNRVTFITCAYFAGIDIQDKCHLITISSQNTAYTYLSVEKITQIAGRGRNGNLSETIIYDIPENKEIGVHKTKEDYRASLLNRAKKYAKFMNATQELVSSDKDLLPIGSFINSFINYISKSRPTTFDYPLSIIRQESLENTFVPAYFNIDSLVEKWQLRHSLYASEFELEKALTADGQNVEVLPPYIVNREEHIVPDKAERREITAARRQKVLEKLTQNLLDWKNNHGNEYALKEISSNLEKRMQDTIIYGFKYLHPYYPTKELIQILIDGYESGKGFKNVFNAAVFHALPLDNTFKAKLFLKFGCKEDGVSDNYITNQQRINIIEECFMETFYKIPPTHIRNFTELATSCLKFHFRRNDQLIRPDGFNPKGLPQPLMTIPHGMFDENTFILPRLKDQK